MFLFIYYIAVPKVKQIVGPNKLLFVFFPGEVDGHKREKLLAVCGGVWSTVAGHRCTEY